MQSKAHSCVPLHFLPSLAGMPIEPDIPFGGFSCKRPNLRRIDEELPNTSWGGGRWPSASHKRRCMKPPRWALGFRSGAGRLASRKGRARRSGVGVQGGERAAER
jgi:hypothetical protein